MLTLGANEAGTLVLTTPGRSDSDNARTHYATRILAALRGVEPGIYDVQIVYCPDAQFSVARYGAIYILRSLPQLFLLNIEPWRLLSRQGQLGVDFPITACHVFVKGTPEKLTMAGRSDGDISDGKR